MNNKTILITGGTGSFGNKFVEMTLNKFNPKKIIIFSRDEMKQWHMSKKFYDKRIRFFLGDIRDKERLNRALDNVDIIVHAAALKIVPTAEYNPFESVKTNIIGAMNIIDIAIEKGIEKVISLSTDKACDPINFYGATKLASDKLFIAGNNYSGKKPTRFSIVRYGNVIGSRGSVIPYFLDLKKNKKRLTITDKKMTRFFTSLEQAVNMVWKCISNMKGGEIFISKNPSVNIYDLAKAIDKKEPKIVGIRPGEKINEVLISKEESVNAYDCGDYYLIFNPLVSNKKFFNKKTMKKCKRDFIYSSEKNYFLNLPQIQAILKKFRNDN